MDELTEIGRVAADPVVGELVDGGLESIFGQPPLGDRSGTGTDPVLLGQVQPVGKQPMPAADWARGVRVPTGAELG